MILFVKGGKFVLGFIKKEVIGLHLNEFLILPCKIWTQKLIGWNLKVNLLGLVDWNSLGRSLRSVSIEQLIGSHNVRYFPRVMSGFCLSSLQRANVPWAAWFIKEERLKKSGCTWAHNHSRRGWEHLDLGGVWALDL